MKACRIHRFGPPDVISLEELAIPEPAADEVIVRVKAASVGPWDGWIRAGKSVLDQPLPLTLGSDFAGTVAALGSDVHQFQLGQAVYGVANPRFTGAHAEYAAAKSDMIARKPRMLGYREAASVPVVAVTAWQMLFDHARLQEGQRVLIHGAGGSVGAFAVQFARAASAYVIATEVRQGGSYAEQLGAHEAIDTGAARFEQALEPVDVVIDTVGGALQSQSLSVLRPGGVLVSSVSLPDANEASRRGVRARFMLVKVTTEALSRIAQLLDEKELVTRVGCVLPLADARVAHEMLEGVRPREPGKIVLQVDDD